MPGQMIFLEFSSEDTVIGKLVFEIFEDIVPRTAKNFISLCCGDPAKVSYLVDGSFQVRAGKHVVTFSFSGIFRTS